MNNRDMYYGSYGFIPQNETQVMQIPISYPAQYTYKSNQINDMNERINRIERQIKRLDQRLTRIETPYINTNNTEPDNNMYIM